MKVCLISPPTIAEFSARQVTESEAIKLIAQHAPMGVLSLAAVLEQAGIEVEVIDLNRLYYQYVGTEQSRDANDFCAYATDKLAAANADVFGLSTICSSYPLTLRLARGVRRAHPDCRIMLGGPQASVVDVATLRSFPEVDYIVRGEAEQSLPALLESIDGAAD